ncbi:MAG: acyl-CoA synthetase [Ilumatobacteraceae bacterium]|nr:acyl-CoA synthetase [Ilumatobacteraceae bacterium]
MSLPAMELTVAYTTASLLRDRADDDHVGYRFEDESWTWREVVRESVARATMLGARRVAGPFHVGVLLENVPEYLFVAGGAAFAGATVVGINPTRRGDELARDVRHTNCQLIITDSASAPLLDGLDLGAATGRILRIDTDEYCDSIVVTDHVPDPSDDPDPATILFLLFTSGSTSAPKAVVCSTERMAGAGVRAGMSYGIVRDDVCYCSMPLFHGNALMACWAPALAVGAEVVLRRKFSASGFLPDVRRYGCTYFTYVGRTIAYVLGQPPTEHDRDHRLRLGFGTEASAQDRQHFLERFGCPLIEGYGSSESVVIIMRTPDTPAGALGVPRLDGGADIAVVDPNTLEPCPPAVFDEHGGLVNGDVAIGEIVNRSGGGMFEGYYNNTEATTDRLRNGWYWTGDLAYVDDTGFYYFAGRSSDWLRVDSENFAAAPVENILNRLDDAVMIAVYAVPDPRTGDQVMAAIELKPGHTFDAAAFAAFLGEQRDLGTKWTPRFVRITADMPLTANNKVSKQPLRSVGWVTTDEIWWQPDRGDTYRLFTADDAEALAAEFGAHGRTALLPR